MNRKKLVSFGCYDEKRTGKIFRIAWYERAVLSAWQIVSRALAFLEIDAALGKLKQLKLEVSYKLAFEFIKNGLRPKGFVKVFTDELSGFLRNKAGAVMGESA